jgi:hypothetical protein
MTIAAGAAGVLTQFCGVVVKCTRVESGVVDGNLMIDRSEIIRRLNPLTVVDVSVLNLFVGLI